MTRAQDFMLPSPYKLDGDYPNQLDPDVKAVYDVATRRCFTGTDQRGLVLQLEATGVKWYSRWYVTFEIMIDGQHMFREASGEQMLFRAWEFNDFLAELETRGHDGLGI